MEESVGRKRSRLIKSTRSEVRQIFLYSHKMRYFVFYVTIFVLFCKVSHSIKTDYYWRDYTGEVPEDAIVGGKDINGKNTYIGQAYSRNEGLIVVQIFPGIKEVEVLFNGIKKVDKAIKILCGPQEQFYWMQSTAATLHLDVIDKHAVIGGYQDNAGYLNIARISHNGGVQICKINSYNAGSAYGYYNHNGAELHITSYEILMYNDNSIDVRVKTY